MNLLGWEQKLLFDAFATEKLIDLDNSSSSSNNTSWKYAKARLSTREEEIILLSKNKKNSHHRSVPTDANYHTSNNGNSKVEEEKTYDSRTKILVFEWNKMVQQMYPRDK